MALVLPPHSMTTSILLHSPSPSPSPASTPLPALQTDLSSSSSSSASGSCLDMHHSSSAPSTRRIRFAPLPDPRRDFLFDPHHPSDEPQLDTKPPAQTLSTPNDLPDGFVALSPSVSPDSTLSSARSTPTIRISTPSNTQKLNMKLFRPFSFLRTSRSSSPSQSPISQSASSTGSCNPPRSSSSLPNSPSFQSAKFRFSTEDILSLGTKSLFRARSGPASSTRSPRTSSPPPKSSDPFRSHHRSATTGSGSYMTLGTGKSDRGEGSSHSNDTAPIAGSGPKRRRASSSALTLGTGGGRHACSVQMQMLPNAPPVRPSTAPSSPTAAPKKHVKMLNGRIYGAKRYAAQTLANPFANVRDEPEFVEWGYGGMGSVHASAGIANDMWKGLQRSERGGALLAGSSFGSASEPIHPTAGGGWGSRARTTSPIARRKMSDNIPECAMGNVGAGGGMDDDDDGSGMGWVKRRRAEKEAKARLEQEANELKKIPQEGRKSDDSMDASMYAFTASTTTSLTACTSAASTDLTTPATSPLVSRSPSLMDLNLTSSPTESRDLRTAPRNATGEESQKSDTPAHLASTSKDEHEHHVLTAVRLSPNIPTSSHKYNHPAAHGRMPSLPHTCSPIGKDTDNGSFEQVAPLSPVDTEETTTSANSFNEDDEEPSRGSDEGEEQDDVDDDEDEVQDIRRKTALGAGVEKISRHVDVEVR